TDHYNLSLHDALPIYEMTINLQMPDIRELKPHIAVFGVGGAGGNAVNNMITSGLLGCDFVVANTDAQALASSQAKRVVQLGIERSEEHTSELQSRENL